VPTLKEYRAVSGIFQTIDPPPLSTQRVCLPHAPKAGRGGTHSPGRKGWGVNILEDARYWIGLLQYNSSTTEALLIYKAGTSKCLPQSKHRVAIAILWRTFQEDGKISPALYTTSPFHSIYDHKQSCGVRPSLEGRYTTYFSSATTCTLWCLHTALYRTG
jgi:hypothetical protein